MLYSNLAVLALYRDQIEYGIIFHIKIIYVKFIKNAKNRFSSYQTIWSIGNTRSIDEVTVLWFVMVLQRYWYDGHIIPV